MSTATIRVLKFNTAINLAGFDAGIKQMQARTAKLSGQIGKALGRIKLPPVNASAFDKSIRALEKSGARRIATVGKSMAAIKAPAVDTKAFDASVSRMQRKAATLGGVRPRAMGAAGATGGGAAKGGGMLGNVGGMVAGAVGGIGAGLGAVNVIKTAADMETKLVGLGKATDLSGSGLAGMKDQIYALGTTMAGVKLDDLFDIATAGAKSGIVDPKALLEFTRGIAMASTAIDDMPALEIADSMAAINTIFRLGSGGAKLMASAIDKLADSGVSSASGIISVTNRVSGFAEAAGITAQETFALSAALLDTKTNPELAATSLERMMAALGDVEGRAGYAKNLGMEASEFASLVEKKPMVAIESFLGALSRMDTVAQGVALKDIGVEGIQGIGELKKLAKASDKVAEYKAMANAEFRLPMQIDKSYAATAASTNAQWDLFNNKIKVLKVGIGDQLLPTINAGMTMLGGFAGRLGPAFTGLLPTFQAVGATIAGAFGGLDLTSFLPTFSTVVGAIKAGIVSIGTAITSTVGFIIDSSVANGTTRGGESGSRRAG